MHRNRDNYNFLTAAPVHKVIHSMAVPTIASMLITNLYNMADTFFVGHIDTQSTAAVGVVFPVMSIIQAIGFFLRPRLGELYIAATWSAAYRECSAYGIDRLLLQCRFWLHTYDSRSVVSYTRIVVAGFYAYYFALYRAVFGRYPIGCTVYDGVAYTQ